MLVSESYGGELHFLVEFFWVVDSSSVYEYGLFHVFGEVFWFEFFNTSRTGLSLGFCIADLLHCKNECD